MEALNQIAGQLRQGIQHPTVTVRTLLAWFGAQRRGMYIVHSIRSDLNSAGLTTIPDFETAWIDAEIRFALAGVAGTTSEAEASDVETVLEAPHDNQPARGVDPTYRVGVLTAANRRPVSVAPNHSVAHAITLMITHDYSQLPVMSGERDVRGVISWRSIGRRLALGLLAEEARHCMEREKVIRHDTPLFTAIDTVYRSDYALIRHADNHIGGIVTTADLAMEFRDLTEPFLFLSEIERNVRALLAGKFTLQDLEAARDDRDPNRAISSPDDLTFGEYIRLLELPENWQRLNLGLDRAIFVKALTEVRNVRNDVMHFNPDPLESEQRSRLRDFAEMFRTLRDCGAV